MDNTLVGLRETRDIDVQVARILKGLGRPEPPLRLGDVRELLRLDRQYYSASDSSVLREFVSKVKIGAKQLALRPTLVLDVIRKADLKALWLPDQKRILIDSSIPDIKKRWAEAHEIGHSVTPWHQEFLFGDDKETLSTDCHAQLEREANYGAGRLLFLQGRFSAEARELPRSLASVQGLSKGFGNTFASTLWRFVEEADGGLPMFGVVSGHPHHGDDATGTWRCRYLLASPSFRGRFPVMTESVARSLMRSYCGWTKRGPLGSGEVCLLDANGDTHRFQMESFSNSYDVLTLGVYIAPVPTVVSGRSR